MKALLALIVVAGAAVYVYGWRTERPFLAMCGGVAVPAAALLVVMVFPGWFFREGK